MRAAARALPALLAIPLGACTLSWIHFGHPVERGAADAVAEGMTKARVLERLGPPDRVEVERLTSAFEYVYREDEGSMLELSFLQASFSYERGYTRSDRLVVRFDPRGLVRDVALVRQTDAPE